MLNQYYLRVTNLQKKKGLLSKHLTHCQRNFLSIKQLAHFIILHFMILLCDGENKQKLFSFLVFLLLTVVVKEKNYLEKCEYGCYFNDSIRFHLKESLLVVIFLFSNFIFLYFCEEMIIKRLNFFEITSSDQALDICNLLFRYFDTLQISRPFIPDLHMNYLRNE